MQYQSEHRFRSRDKQAQGGGTPKREKEKKQPNLVMPIAIGLFIVGMLHQGVFPIELQVN